MPAKDAHPSAAAGSIPTCSESAPRRARATSIPWYLESLSDECDWSSGTSQECASHDGANVHEIWQGSGFGLRRREIRLLAVAALRHVVGNAGKDETSSTGHVNWIIVPSTLNHHSRNQSYIAGRSQQKKGPCQTSPSRRGRQPSRLAKNEHRHVHCKPEVCPSEYGSELLTDSAPGNLLAE